MQVGVTAVIVIYHENWPFWPNIPEFGPYIPPNLSWQGQFRLKGLFLCSVSICLLPPMRCSLVWRIMKRALRLQHDLLVLVQVISVHKLTFIHWVGGELMYGDPIYPECRF